MRYCDVAGSVVALIFIITMLAIGAPAQDTTHNVSNYSISGELDRRLTTIESLRLDARLIKLETILEESKRTQEHTSSLMNGLAIGITCLLVELVIRFCTWVMGKKSV